MGNTVSNVGNAVGGVAKTVVNVHVQVATAPAKAVAKVAQVEPVVKAIEKVETTTKHIAGGVVNGVIKSTLAPTVTALNVGEKVVKGEFGQALEEAKNGVINHLLATNPLTETVMTSLRVYAGTLEEQAEGKWKKLPQELIKILEEYYSFDLDMVKFATSINTGHGQATTIEDQIFFPQEIDLENKDDLKWMLHELVHVQQYLDAGGFESFMLKYLVQGGAEIIKHKSFSIHDLIPLEGSANGKAKAIIDQVYQAFMPSPGMSLSM